MTRLCTLFAVLLLPSVASTQPVDYDAAEEEYSELWQSVLAPGGPVVNEAVDAAREAANRPSTRSLDRAERLLGEAIAKYPKHAALYYWLGRTHGARGTALSSREDREPRTKDAWQDCVAAFQKARALSPTESLNDSLEGLPYQLAACAARAHQFELAEEQLSQVRPRRPRDKARVQLLFGETYMALGRLDEAISAFKKTMLLRSPTDPEAHFALAVAYDRDEQTALSRDHLAVALKREPRFHSLWVHGRVYAPAEDRHYYLGLAYLARGERSWSLYHWRRYKNALPKSVWQHRVREHYANASRFRIGDDVEVKGTATVDLTRARQAVNARAKRLSACVKQTKEMLLEVRVTQFIGPRPKRIPGGVRPGAHVLVHRLHGATQAARKDAVRCVEAAAKGIRLPAPRGVRGSWATVEFTVIAPE